MCSEIFSAGWNKVGIEGRKNDYTHRYLVSNWEFLKLCQSCSIFEKYETYLNYVLNYGPFQRLTLHLKNPFEQLVR